MQFLLFSFLLRNQRSTRGSVAKAVRVLSYLFFVLAMAIASPGQVDTKVRPAPDFGRRRLAGQGAPVPHHIADYRGKVVLVDFWEYTCINCIRDFGVVKRWYTKYHHYGFEVIGVHFGEFNIGFDVNNVRRGGPTFHTALAGGGRSEGHDVEGFKANGWPDRFLVDPQGKIVMKVFGEGNNVSRWRRRFGSCWPWRIPRS